MKCDRSRNISGEMSRQVVYKPAHLQLVTVDVLLLYLEAKSKVTTPEIPVIIPHCTGK